MLTIAVVTIIFNVVKLLFLHSLVVKFLFGIEHY